MRFVMEKNSSTRLLAILVIMVCAFYYYFDVWVPQKEAEALKVEEQKKVSTQNVTE
jgi:hypothetical protein